MPITHIPQRQSAFQRTIDPYLQMAMQTMLQRQLQKQQYQQGLEALTPTAEDIQQQAQTQYGTKLAGVPEKVKKKYQIAQQKMGMEPAMPEVIRKYKQAQKALGPDYALKQQISPTTTIGPREPDIWEPVTPEEQLAWEKKKAGAKADVMVERKKKMLKQEAQLQGREVQNMVDAVWNKADELIPAPEGGGAGLVAGVSRQITMPLRMNEKALAFEQYRDATLSLMIRSLGEKGMLTDRDIERARKFEPNIYDSRELREQKKKAMREFLQSKINAHFQGEEFEGTIGIQSDPLGLR